jgi:hypothetical protein
MTTVTTPFFGAWVNVTAVVPVGTGGLKTTLRERRGARAAAPAVGLRAPPRNPAIVRRRRDLPAFLRAWRAGST